MRCSVYLPVCEPGRAPRLGTGPAPSPPQACLADGRCLLTPCRAERDSLENTLLDTQRLSGQLQAEREQLEGETQSLRLARQTLQGALGGLHGCRRREAPGAGPGRKAGQWPQAERGGPLPGPRAPCRAQPAVGGPDHGQYKVTTRDIAAGPGRLSPPALAASLEQVSLQRAGPPQGAREGSHHGAVRPVPDAPVTPQWKCSS